MPEHEQQEEFSFKNYFVPLTTLKAISWIVIVGLILYFNTLFNGFVGDDTFQISIDSNIPLVQKIPNSFFENKLSEIGTIHGGGLYYRPLFDILLASINSFLGTSPFGFHLVQIVLFIVNACLLFLFLKKFFRKSISFLLSLFYLIHPINSEVAFYISDIQDVLFFFFGILGLLIISKSQSQKSFILANLFFLFSVLSKETGLLFFIIAFVYVFLFKRKYISLSLFYSFLGVGIYTVLRIHAVGFIGTSNDIFAPIEKLSLVSRLINIPAIFLFYLTTFFFPLSLSVSYMWTYNHIDFVHFVVPLIIDLIFLTFVFIFLFKFYKSNTRKYFVTYLFFTIWFLLGLVFTFQIFPLDQTVADRWFYFPFIGIIGIIGVLLEKYHFNLKNKWIVSIILVIFILLSYRTFIRSFDWRDYPTLAEHDIQVSQDAFNLDSELSSVSISNGKYEDAKVYAQRSISIYPYKNNYLNLATAYYRLGNFASAQTAYEKALQYGDDDSIYDNLGSLTLVSGDPSQNINFLKKIALKKYPQDRSLMLYLSIDEYKGGETENAKLEIQKLYNLQKDPQTTVIYEKIMKRETINISLQNDSLELK